MLYDANGRLLIKAQIEAETAYFLSDTYVRLRNGRLQLKNDTDGLWYTIYLQNDPSTGLPILSPADTGESS